MTRPNALAEPHPTVTIDGWEEIDHALVLSLVFRPPWSSVEGPGVGAALHSRKGDVHLRFGPRHDVSAWPAWLCRHAAYQADGAALALRLDPGDEPERAGRMSAFSLVGSRDGEAMLAILAPLSTLLRQEAAAEGADWRLRQAADVVAAFDEPLFALASTHPARPVAAKPDVFAPSFCGPGTLDDIFVSATWRHVRLGYALPRLWGVWTRAVTWRVYQAERRFGLEFRMLSGDHAPPDLMRHGQADAFGPLLRAEMDLDAPLATSPSIARLPPERHALVVALARQTARDLPPLLRAGGLDASGFGSERWRHWTRLLPDVLARMRPGA